MKPYTIVAAEAPRGSYRFVFTVDGSDHRYAVLVRPGPFLWRRAARKMERFARRAREENVA